MANDRALPDIDTARHSLSHVLATAVLKVCPGAQLGIGPAIDEGFYYDFKLPEGVTFSPDVVAAIEAEMRNYLKNDVSFERKHIGFDEARQTFADAPFKLELIKDLQAAGEQNVSTYRSEPFLDLCNGPHVEHTRQLRSVAWQIDRVSGAYWRGDSNRDMLQRIYVLAFASKDELKDYLNRRKLAAERDHRKLGQELELHLLGADWQGPAAAAAKGRHHAPGA